VTEWYFAQQLSKAFGGNGDGNGGDGEDSDHESQTVSTYTAMNSSDDDGDANNDDNKGNDDGDSDNGNNKSNQSPTPIAAAALRVLKPIEIPNGIIQPGDYVMHWWFDSNAVFYAVTLTGVTTDNTVVTNQQIPGVPATFIDRRREGPRQPASQISAWRVRINWFGREVRGCVLGESC
jgi:hypothetical protein